MNAKTADRMNISGVYIAESALAKFVPRTFLNIPTYLKSPIPRMRNTTAKNTVPPYDNLGWSELSGVSR